MSDAATWIFPLLQVFFVDLLLGADNVIVIALACRRLPPEDTRRAVMFGAVGAIVLRLTMVIFANALLGVPLVKLAGAWMLIVIALNVKDRGREDGGALRGAGPATDFVSAAAVIMLADAAMSLDNVVALAAIAGGNLWLLGFGVLLSIPILAYGALILTEIIGRAPEILKIGAAFLGWIAGGMAVSDPLVAGWISANAPALPVVAPPLAALFILAAGKDGERSALRPLPAAPGPAPVSKHDRISPSNPPPTKAPDAALETLAPQAASRISAPPERTSAITAFARGGWTEERVVIVGFVLLAFIAGLIIFLAAFLDSLT
jgi:YjbE family integral membrane protein